MAGRTSGTESFRKVWIQRGLKTRVQTTDELGSHRNNAETGNADVDHPHDPRPAPGLLGGILEMAMEVPGRSHCRIASGAAAHGVGLLRSCSDGSAEPSRAMVSIPRGPWASIYVRRAG